MLDIRLIRKDRKSVEDKLKTKDPSIDLSNICRLDQEIRENKTKVEQLKARRNEISQKIGELKRAGNDTTQLMAEVAESAEETHRLDHQLKQLEEEFNLELARIPNLPMDDIKVSQDPKENVVVKE